MASFVVPHRFCSLLWSVIITILGSASCLPLGDDSICRAAEFAKYSLVFTGKWSETTFPKQYPLYRPPAQWSSLLGATHSSDYYMWRKDEYASNGVREFSEKGEAWLLMKEIEAAGEKIQSVHGIFSASAIPSGVGQSSTELEVHSRHSLVSFMVRIVPSPDWFVGVSSLNLCEGDHWKEQVSFDLYPYDAGTDSGFTFSSPNLQLFHKAQLQRLKKLPPIATVTIVKLKSKHMYNPISEYDLTSTGNKINDSVSETPLDCEVSLWSSWGLCKGSCGNLGSKSRTRYIRLKPANSGAPCPSLEEEAECKPDNCV